MIWIKTKVLLFSYNLIFEELIQIYWVSLSIMSWIQWICIIKTFLWEQNFVFYYFFNKEWFFYIDFAIQRVFPSLFKNIIYFIMWLTLDDKLWFLHNLSLGYHLFMFLENRCKLFFWKNYSMIFFIYFNLINFLDNK